VERLTLNVLAIDPGASIGWAWYPRGALAACGRVAREIDLVRALWDYDLRCVYTQQGIATIIECPRVYPHGKVDPNDLIVLARRVGRLEANWPGAETVFPREWKGTLTKAVCHARGLAVLDDSERAIVAQDLQGVPASARHDAMDAVCLGLWRLRRLHGMR
jgi:hypothetical protein